MLVSTEAASEAILGFERYENYYRGNTEEAQAWRGRLLLSVMRCCEVYSIDPAALVQRCIESYDQCPSDHQLIEAAKGIRGAYSEPEAPSEARECAACHGSGWVRVFALHTPEGTGRSSYVRQEIIDEEAYRAFNKARLGPGNRQEVYSGVFRCQHGGGV